MSGSTCRKLTGGSHRRSRYENHPPVPVHGEEADFTRLAKEDLIDIGYVRPGILQGKLTQRGIDFCDAEIPEASKRPNVGFDAIPPAAECEFRKIGTVWALRFKDKTAHVEALVGMDYIAELLRRPGSAIEAHSLVAAHGQNTGVPVPMAEARVVGATAAMQGIPLTDAQAIRTIRTDLARKKAELKECPANDETRTELERKIAQLQKHLTQVEGRRGRSRTTGGIAARSRSSVKHAINRAIAKIGKQHLPLANHLQDSIRTGDTLAYAPREVPDWQF